MTDWTAGFLFGLLVCYALSFIVLALVMIFGTAQNRQSHDPNDHA